MRFKLIILAMLVVLLASCGQNYNYSWKVKVTYQNGDIDTLYCEYPSFRGLESYITLLAVENKGFSAASTTGTLVVGCGGNYTNVACGVRNFSILESHKIPIDGN